MKKIICILIVGILLLTACSVKKKADERWPVEIEGNTFTEPAYKVVSLSPSVTEMMYMLGYGGRLDGTSDFCETPDSAKKLPNCGSYLMPNLEKIAKISPDLLFTPAALSKHDTAALQELGVQVVVVTAPETVKGMLENCRLIVSAFEGAEKADLRVRELESFFDVTLDYLAGEVKDQIGTDSEAIYLRKMPFMMATSDSLESELLIRIGFINSAEKYTGWNYPSEDAVALEPHYIFCDDSINIEDLQKHKNYKTTAAVTNQNVFELKAEYFERRSPRLFFELEEVLDEALPDGLSGDKPNFVIDIEPPPEPEKSWWEKIMDKF